MGPQPDRRSLIDLLAPTVEHAEAELETEAELSLADGKTPAHAEPSRVKAGVGSGVVGAGLGAVILALDKVLRDHGETLETMASAGPLTAALLQNWPIVLALVLLARAAATRWREHVAKQRGRDRLAARQGAATIKTLRLVAVETDRVVAELGALRGDLAEVGKLAAATDARTRQEAADLRRHVDDLASDLRTRVGRIEAIAPR